MTTATSGFANCLVTVQKYIWSDSEEEMTALIGECISGEVSERSGVVKFEPEPIKDVMRRMVCLADAFGHQDLFKDLIIRVSSIVIRPQRWQMSSGRTHDISTSSAILAYLLPPPVMKRKGQLDQESQSDIPLPTMRDLPRRRVPIYHINLAEDDKGAAIERITEIALGKVIGEREEPKAKRRKLSHPSQESPGSQRSFAQGSPSLRFGDSWG